MADWINARLDPYIIPEPMSGCWLWLGTISSQGYGRIGHRYAHREVYVVERRAIPEGTELDHLCRNRACCNPDHLEPVTHRVNTQRGLAGKYQTARTHCPQGHEYTPANTQLYRNRRICRACHLVHARASRARLQCR